MFTGDTKQRTIRLGGRRDEQDLESLQQRVQQERAARHRAKAQQSGAAIIQASWRAYLQRGKEKDQLVTRFDAAYAAALQHPPGAVPAAELWSLLRLVSALVLAPARPGMRLRVAYQAEQHVGRVQAASQLLLASCASPDAEHNLLSPAVQGDPRASAAWTLMMSRMLVSVIALLRYDVPADVVYAAPSSKTIPVLFRTLLYLTESAGWTGLTAATAAPAAAVLRRACTSMLTTAVQRGGLYPTLRAFMYRCSTVPSVKTTQRVLSIAFTVVLRPLLHRVDHSHRLFMLHIMTIPLLTQRLPHTLFPVFTGSPVWSETLVRAAADPVTLCDQVATEVPPMRALERDISNGTLGGGDVLVAPCFWLLGNLLDLGRSSVKSMSVPAMANYHGLAVRLLDLVPRRWLASRGDASAARRHARSGIASRHEDDAGSGSSSSSGGSSDDEDNANGTGAGDSGANAHRRRKRRRRRGSQLHDRRGSGSGNDSYSSSSGGEGSDDGGDGAGSNARSHLRPRCPPALRQQLETLVQPQYLSSQLLRLTGSGREPSASEEVNAVLLRVALMYVTVMRRWPARQDAVAAAIAYQPMILQALWAAIDSQNLPRSMQRAEDVRDDAAALIALFCVAYQRTLYTQDDASFFEQQVVFKIPTLVQITTQLTSMVFQMLWKRWHLSSTGVYMRNECTHLLHRLRDRNARRAYCPKDVWIAPVLQDAPLALDDPILRQLPFVVPFMTRVAIFEAAIAEDRGGSLHDMMYGTEVRIRRTHVFEDGYEQLNHLGPKLKQRLKVKFFNAQGQEEPGVDGGGLFKEFVNDLVKVAFDASFGLFKASSDNQLYPNPSSRYAAGVDHLSRFEFLGRVLGKALYDGILVDLPFAAFFLSKLLGRSNLVNELPSLDPELHRNLMFLKTYDGDFDDLGLTFSLSEDHLGKIHSVDLIANGAATPVTRENRFLYIARAADYRLNRSIQRQCQAFLRGFTDLVSPNWLSMFSQDELQTLISGTTGAIDVDDMQAHTNVTKSHGGPHADLAVSLFWRLVREFDNEQLAALLKFVTSCPRPPLLGFAALNPALGIQVVPDSSRLPTASTCFNLLKLPAYTDLSTMREKLLYSINSGAGFELS